MANVFKDILHDYSETQDGPKASVEAAAEAVADEAVGDADNLVSPSPLPEDEEVKTSADLPDENEETDEAEETVYDKDEESLEEEGLSDEGGAVSETEMPAEKETFTVKVDGVESEVTSDQLIRNYQISRAAEKRLEEASQRQAQLEQVANQLTQNPFETLFRLYNAQLKDPVLAQKKLFNDTLEFVRPFIEEQALPEDQQRVRQKERELQFKEQEIQEQRSHLEQTEQGKQFEDQRRLIIKDVQGAIKEVGLDQYQTSGAQNTLTYRVIRLMAAQQDVDPSNPLTARAAAEHVKADVEQEVKTLLGSMEVDEMERVNPDALKAIRKQNLQKAKKKRSTRRGKAVHPEPTETSKKAKAKSEAATSREFFNEILAGVND